MTSNHEAQESTDRRDHWEVPALQTARPPDERRQSNLTRTTSDPLIDSDYSDGPPGLAYVSGSSDAGEDSGDLSDDDRMPGLQPIGFYHRNGSSTASGQRAAGAVGSPRAPGTSSQSNIRPSEMSPAETTRSARPRDASPSLSAQPTDRSSPVIVVGPPIFQDQVTMNLFGQVWPNVAALYGNAPTTANRAHEIVKTMHILNEAELKRYETLIMLQADNEEDRARGACCAVCWEVLTIPDGDNGISMDEGKGKGKESSSSSSPEPEASSSSAPSANADSENENKILALPCTHVFHSACLIKWFGRSATCPECRFNLDPSRHIAPARNPLIPRPAISRDIYDLYNRTRRDGGQDRVSSSTSARSRSLPRRGDNDPVLGTGPLEPLQSGLDARNQAPSLSTTIQQVDHLPMANPGPSEDRLEPTTSANDPERPDETSTEPASEDTGRDLDQPLPTDPLQSRAQPEGETDSPITDLPRAVNDAIPQSDVSQGVSQISERLNGIRNSLSSVQGRLRNVENRLESVEGRLRTIEPRSERRSNALDSTRVLGGRQDVGLFDVGSREEAIRRLRFLATGGSGTASVNRPAAPIQTTGGQLLGASPSPPRNENNPVPPPLASQPSASSGTAVEETLADVASSPPSEPASTTALMDAAIEENETPVGEMAGAVSAASLDVVERMVREAGIVLRQSIDAIHSTQLGSSVGSDSVNNFRGNDSGSGLPSLGQPSHGGSISAEENSLPSEGASIPLNVPASHTENDVEDTPRLLAEVRQLEAELESDYLVAEMGQNALRQLGGMMNNISQVLREAARRGQALNQAIDTIHARTQGQPGGPSSLDITSTNPPQIGPSILAPPPGSQGGPDSSNFDTGRSLGFSPGGRNRLQGPHAREYVPPPGKMTFEEMLVLREKEQGLRCPGVCSKLLEDGGCLCPIVDRSDKAETSE
ncbi:hypothetical protein FRC04_003406 [Tulasnella sp. 424]|nr:hypothetical protein FRC04_003406 [Tulasnella sp. 424]